MSVALTQSNDAAFPDRHPAGHGLAIACVPGLSGGVLDVNYLGTSLSSFCRFMMNPHDLSGGTLRIAAASTSNQTPAWTLDYDATARSLTLSAPGTANLTATLPTEFAWHAVEIGHEPGLNTVTLWLHGRPAGSAALPTNTAAARRFHLGGMFKEHGVVGRGFIDEWAIADTYVGPVVVQPTSPYANDPARWLVLYRAADPDSRTWAEQYRAARNIPHSNLLGLDAPAAETIDLATYQQLLGQIETYLNRNRLRPQITGLLLGHGLPGYVQHPSLGQVHPLGSLLHTEDDDLNLRANPVANLDPLTRPTATSLSGVRFTARLDGPTLADSLALTQRADDLAATTLTADDRLWVDPIPAAAALMNASQELMDWHAGLDRQRLRLDTELRGDPVLDPEADFPAIHHDAFYWGWGSATPPTGFFGDPAGARAVCVQLRQPDVAATTLRSSTPANWIDTALAGGYAAAVAASQSTSFSALPRAGAFFEALRLGWTLAEAWLVAQPLVRGGLFLVGDPLLTVRTPRAGWDVFGPLDTADAFDAAAPIAVLPRHVLRFTLPPEGRPMPGDAALYLVRRADDDGRSEAGFLPLRVAHHQDQPATPAPVAAWPQRDGWAMAIRDQYAVAALILPGGDVHAETLVAELFDDRGRPPIVVALTPRDPWVETLLPLDVTPTRYRWRLTSAAGPTWLSPWSRPIASLGPRPEPLTPTEARS